MARSRQRCDIGLHLYSSRPYVAPCLAAGRDAIWAIFGRTPRAVAAQLRIADTALFCPQCTGICIIGRNCQCADKAICWAFLSVRCLHMPVFHLAFDARLAIRLTYVRLEVVRNAIQQGGCNGPSPSYSSPMAIAVRPPNYVRCHGVSRTGCLGEWPHQPMGWILLQPRAG